MGLGLEGLDTCHLLCPLLVAHLQLTKVLKYTNSRRGKKAAKQIFSLICIVTPDKNSAKGTDFLSFMLVSLVQQFAKKLLLEEWRFSSLISRVSQRFQPLKQRELQY